MMKLLKYLGGVACLMAVTACHDFESLNTNPYEPVYDPTVEHVSPDGIDLDYTLSDRALASLKSMEGAVGSLFAHFTYEGVYNDYQVTTNLTHDLYAGYWANNVSEFVDQSPTYAYTDNWSAVRWKHFYDDRSVSEYAQLVKTFHFCNRDFYHTAFYLTRIYYAFLLSMQTDTYGDIPVAYYVKGALPPQEQVTYQSQREVYAIIFQLLEQAVTQLRPENRPDVPQYDLGSNDKCYGGKVDRWLRLANTLRLRLALRVSNVDPDWAQVQARAALTDPAGLMQGPADNLRQVPKRQYQPGGNENIFALLFSWMGNVVLSQELEWAYKNQSWRSAAPDGPSFNEDESVCNLDPRCEVLWFRPTPFDSLTARPFPLEHPTRPYRGVRNGEINVGASYLNCYSPGRCLLTSEPSHPDYWWTLAREIVWVGYAESLFLKAEAALRWPSLVGESPETLYLQGIRASMDYYGIASDRIDTYLQGLQGKAAFAEGSREEQLEQIITQKWLAVFPNGNEGWAEVRRTDYPRYLQAPLGGNQSNGEVLPGKLIKRLRYPNSEARNPHRPQQVHQGTRVWWDVADTMDDTGKWRQPTNFR